MWCRLSSIFFDHLLFIAGCLYWFRVHYYSVNNVAQVDPTPVDTIYCCKISCGMWIWIWQPIDRKFRLECDFKACGKIVVQPSRGRKLALLLLGLEPPQQRSWLKLDYSSFTTFFTYAKKFSTVCIYDTR